MRILPEFAFDEYLFGSDLLVAPVHTPGQHRILVLPPGRWTDFWTGASVESGTFKRDVPIDGIPVFLRSGALVPVELAPGFVLGDSMSQGRVAALLVTPPSETATVHHWNLPGRSERIDLRSTPNSTGFTISTTNWHELQYLVVSGLRGISSVTVDGEKLAQLDATGSNTLPPGWKRLNANQYLIRLPNASKHEIRIVTE